MKSKTVSVNLEINWEVPFKETYLTIYNSKQKVKMHQKFTNSRKNQKIELNFKVCERLMNLLVYYVFNRKYKYSKDEVLIYRE